ncbi:MAG: HD domain-containing protein [Defluviitaleaceae bacterium]|nr:HD domain-containing protein [Defluviitaleaceae bacterium]
MKRVNLILNHPLYAFNLESNITMEKGWRYCKHDIIHLMDVARIAYILNLENGYGFPKEQVYAAALLHDITKWKQISEGIPHHESAIEPATKILKDCGFSSREIKTITTAILNHRKGPKDKKDKFSQIIFKADKLSRTCYFCNYEEKTCNWDKKKKSTKLEV